MTDATIPGFNPHDFGFAAWTFSPILATGATSASATSGTLVYTDVKCGSMPITNVFIAVTEKAKAAKAKECWIAVYDRDSGTQLGGEILNIAGTEANQIEAATAPESLLKVTFAKSFTVPSGVARIVINQNAEATKLATFATSVAGKASVYIPKNAPVVPTGAFSGTANTSQTTTAPTELGAQTRTEAVIWAAVS